MAVVIERGGAPNIASNELVCRSTEQEYSTLKPRSGTGLTLQDVGGCGPRRSIGPTAAQPLIQFLKPLNPKP